MTAILEVQGMEILDSRGNPTVSVRVCLASGAEGTAAVPSGASTGAFEAHELRDGGARYGGKGTHKAVEQINRVIAPELVGVDADAQEVVDSILAALDGTPNKSRLGANAILGVSLAAARAASADVKVPLYRYLGGLRTRRLPVPLMNLLNGGKHADNPLSIQEFMVVPAGAKSFSQGLEMAVATYSALRARLKAKGLTTGVGDEGGFAPEIEDDELALELLVSAVEDAGAKPGKDMVLALDLAANELRDGSGYKLGGKHLEPSALIDLLEGWVGAYPIASIEDPLSEDDFEAWKELTRRLGGRVQLVGDDLFVTQTPRLRMGIEEGMANAILIKPNQVGTLTETLQAMETAAQAGYRTIVSHRSGETPDTFIADLAVATGSTQIKAGAPARGERVAKYNRLLEIEAQLPEAEYGGQLVFPGRP